MAVPAASVAAVLRQRLPGLGIKKLHKLLYYAQGHHLATFGRPLFSETISAWDMGPVVGQLWYAERQGEAPAPSADASDLGEAALNTLGYVLSRYGALTGRDLEHLTHSEAPWKRANAGRGPGQSARIDLSWLQEYFAADAQDEEDAGPRLDASAVHGWLRSASDPGPVGGHPDTREDLLARLGRRGA